MGEESEDRRSRFFSLDLEGSAKQFTKLFRLRDDAQALLESLSKTEMDTFDTLYLSTSLYSKYFRLSPKLADIEIGDDDWPLPTKNHGDEFCMDELIPVTISLPNPKDPDFKEKLLNNLKYLESKLISKHKWHPSRIDLYFVIFASFSFIRQNRNEIISFFNGKDRKGKESRQNPCEVCGDVGLSPLWFCGSRCCGKCVRFFVKFVAQRDSLRCLSEGTCSVSTLNLQCKKCRMRRCTSLGMTAEYFSNDEYKNRSAVCRICKTPDVLCQNLSGIFACADCTKFYRRSVYKDNYKEYDCCGDNKNCEIEEIWRKNNTEEKRCDFCLFQRCRNVGLSDSHVTSEEEEEEEKLNPTTDNSENNNSGNCVVCNKELTEENEKKLFLGLNCCLVCRMFLKLSLVSKSVQFNYSCRGGESGNLCPVNPHNEFWTSKCSYCWFRIIEMEGLVERWNICDGKPEHWDRLCSTPSPKRARIEDNEEEEDVVEETEIEAEKVQETEKEKESEKEKEKSDKEAEISDLLGNKGDDEEDNEGMDLDLELENLEKELDLESEEMLSSMHKQN